VRRAAAGEVVRIRVSGRTIARLAPLDADPSHTTSLDALIATGALVPARRTDGQPARGAVRVWRNARLDLLLREIRG
jgi:antitoxin (DNA-binding transcriptional repressor) of toxin-antitoxin stability system